MWVKILLLFFTSSFLIRTDHSFDQDLGRHIKTGEVILKTWSVPKVNLFSYTNPDFPFINTHWLFGVVAYFFQQTIGLHLLLILKVLIILTSVWITLSILDKKNYPLLLPLGFIFLHVLRERTELRPEIFSFLFTATTYYILENSRQKSSGRKVFILPFIQLIWVNMHIYFFVGLIIQAIFILSYGVKLFHPRGVIGRHLGILISVFVISVLVSLINPNGINGFLYPLNVNKNYGYSIVENQTMFFLEKINFRNPNFLFVKITIGLIIGSVLVSISRKSFSLKNNLLALSGVGLALMHVRSFPYLVFLSLIPTIQNLGVIRNIPLIKLLNIIFATLLIVESLLYLNGSYYKYTDSDKRVNLRFEESAKEALDFVISNNLEGPIFNNFDIGSYIIYRGYPNIKVFVDGRPESYPVEFLQGVYIPIQSDYQKFKEAAKEFGFKTVIFSHTDQTPWGQNFLKNIIADSNWKVAYFDDFMIVLVKNDLENVDKVEFNKLQPSGYDFPNSLSYLRMGIFLINQGFGGNGVLFINKALELRHSSTSLYFW